MGAVSLVQGQNMGHITVGVPAQDLQVPQHHGTHITAQVRKKSGALKHIIKVIIFSELLLG